MLSFLSHLFIPRPSNNHRAKLLHHEILVVVIFLFLFLQIVFPFAQKSFPQVLGASTISIQELVSLTNQQRTQNGLPRLVLNQKLTYAAEEKARGMFAKNYWAHNAPDGTTPWSFIKSSQYEYEYAGENLAKGFDSARDVMTAWMNSPEHRENILSENYQDVGFAVQDGKLQGEDTTLVVEMFGSKTGFVPQTPNLPVSQITTQQENNQRVPGLIKGINITGQNNFSRTLSFVILCIFIFALTLDIIVVKRKNIMRVAGHNLDHIFFFGIIILVVMLVGKGAIL